MPLQGEYEPSPVPMISKQVSDFERTGGAEGGTMMGLPVIILTSLGASSGKIRKTPLMRVEHDGEYAVVASKGGAPDHPSWYHNLVAHPEVELQDGPERHDYRARQVSGAERQEWWDRCVAAFPQYAAYAEKTDREIPVFVLSRG
ncbi:MAG: nitroreductase family deazaflavin-dependent oxidoreductase [Candidatus Nanopelagicales bacterium]